MMDLQVIRERNGGRFITFGKKKPSVSVADPASRNVSGSATEHANDDSTAMDQSSVSYNLEDGNSLVGTIDAKFDYGYVISVNLGSENLNGVLYNTPALPNQFQKVYQEKGVRDKERYRAEMFEYQTSNVQPS
ncbi:hypothetical protein RDI58_027239 [Solanum bulbocastanum]|uniref:Uncharacterized protein n=1 Tax=Solanum bulbocastanum TaxID=147425 RepID=A0AAN8SV05_SOLBU